MNPLMSILIAEDNMAMRMALTVALKKTDFECVVAEDGTQAWEIMRQPDAPMLALIDWQMPGISGLEVIRQIRSMKTDHPPYIILLTAMREKSDIVQGLEAGANDYVVKPYDPNELRARIAVGRRMVELQATLAKRVQELQTALTEIKTLRGIIPICANCKKIRDDKGFWQQVESYVSARTDADFSHGICPDCAKKLYPDYYDESDFEEPQKEAQ